MRVTFSILIVNKNLWKETVYSLTILQYLTIYRIKRANTAA